MQPISAIHQLGYVVADLDAALKYWTKALNVAPFYVYRECPLINQVHRGIVGEEAITDIAIAYTGGVQIELIEQKNDAPSVYKEWLDAGNKALHHIALMPEDYASTRQSYLDNGCEAALEATIAGVPLVYFDTVQTLGHFTELWGNDPVLKGLFSMVYEAHTQWDGSDPIRIGEL